MTTRERVRNKTGVAVASDFDSPLGTPIVIDDTASTGAMYFRDASGNVVRMARADRGSWTPAGNGVTFSAATGKYTKIDDMVYARFNIVFPSTADTGDAQIKGLPFTIGGSGGEYGAGILSRNDSGNVTLVQPINGQTYAQLVNNSAATYTNANFSTKQIIGIVIYTTT